MDLTLPEARWIWLALGVAAMAAEMLLPGFFLLWLGAAAFGVGLVLLAVPDLPLAVQLIGFAVFAVLAIVAGRRIYAPRHGAGGDPADRLNRPGEVFVGRGFVLDQPLVGGRGRMRCGDGTWAVRLAEPGPDLAAGTRVIVVAADTTVLHIRAE